MSTSSLDETVLEQFTILRGIEEVSIRGAVTEDYAQRLKNIIRDSAPVVDLWEQYNLLLRWHLASRKILQTRFQDSREGKEPGFLDHFNRTKSIAPDIDAAKVAMMCGDVEGFMRAKEVVVERLQCDYAEVMKHIRTIDATRTMLMGLRGKKEE